MFVQEAPRLGNRLTGDPAVGGALRRLLSPDAWSRARDELTGFAGRVGGEFTALALEAEAHPPRHVPFDAWGRRVDRVEVSPAWLELVRIGLENGLVAAPYENPGPDGRVLQAALIQLFQPAAAMSTCPMAMSDGAARVLLAHDRELAARYVPRLTRRSGAWTSGQWMTETSGGSDVSRTEVVARPAGDATDGRWTLHGTKWFTSATTADIALVLARPEGPGGSGTGDLSLFLVELRRPDGSWNGLEVRRLKDKMGTRALPTAELELRGTPAVPVGGLGRGVAKVATMLNVTRLWSAYGGVGPAGHLLTLARDYATRREAFGRRLTELPIHTHWLAELAAVYEATVALSFQAAWLVGAAEAGQGDPLLARIITPIAKMACARQALSICSELVETFGGAGYLEDTGIPVIFRDAHVQVIWEGTSSVMAHDVLRALGKAGAREAFHEDLDQRLARAGQPGLADTLAEVTKAAARLRQLTAEADEAAARPLAWSLARTYQAALLCEAASQDPGDRRLAAAARLFARQPLVTAYAEPECLDILAYGGRTGDHAEPVHAPSSR
jgi:acyl-CoA dehydrogenase